MAVLLNEPVAAALTFAVTTKVMWLPEFRFTLSLMFPLPFDAVVESAAPDEGVTVNVSLVMSAGKRSATVAPVTLLGPLLVTTIVYVAAVPGTTLPIDGLMLDPPSLSTEVIARSAGACLMVNGADVAVGR